MRLACYCRYSSDNQRDESIDAQLRAIHKWAEDNNHIVSFEYVDRALSGKTDNRPEFMRMIADGDKNIWDGVVVHKMDRFSRDKYDSVFYKKRLRDNKKVFFSVTENIGDDPSSVILESMLEGMAQYYVTNLAREVKKGLNENAYNCKYNGGTPPLGYDVDKDKKYIINELEAKIVREIFELYISGMGLLKIALTLNERGYKTKRSNSFGKNSLFDILGNERYTGTYIYNQSINSNKRVNNENIIKIENGMPQIISKGDFEKVMQIRKGNKVHAGKYKAKTEYLLTGLIKCGECGRNYIGHTTKREFATKDYVTSWYQCSGRNKLENCKNENVKRDKLEEEILKIVQEKMSNTFELDKLVQGVVKKYKELYDNCDTDTKNTKHQLALVNQKIKNFCNAIGNGLYSDSIKSQLEEAEKTEQILNQKLLELSSLKSSKEIDTNKISKLISSSFKGFSKKTISEQKKLIKHWIKEIKITPDYAEITFTFENTSYFQLAEKVHILLKIRIDINKLK
jgi:site-specific DNA recombinase